jgi:hypothetical protein
MTCLKYFGKVWTAVLAFGILFMGRFIEAIMLGLFSRARWVV